MLIWCSEGLSCVFETCCDQGITSEKTLFPVPSNCPGCFLFVWTPLVFMIDLSLVLWTGQENWTDSKEHRARKFLRGQISSFLVYHRCVIVMMVKAPSTILIPAFIKEAPPSGFIPHRGPASWAACCYQSWLAVCSVSDVIASNAISSAGTWLNQTQHLYFPEIFIMVTVWLF